MNFNRRMKWALATSGLIAFGAAAGSAQALTPIAVNGVVAISLADYAVTLTAPGQVFLNGPIQILPATGVPTPACTASGLCNYGSGELSVTLGQNPTALISATPANNGGGDSSLFVSYSMMYQGPANTTVDAFVHTSDIIDQTGDSAGAAVMTVSGINGTVYEAYNCVGSPLAAFGCGSNVPNVPFADAPVTLVDNTVYTIDLELEIYAHDPVSVQIDPYFTAPAGAGGEFVFSPGITGGGVPEPAAWTLMVVGFGGLGAALRSRRRAGLMGSV